jgi:holo-[acyl-carrier protein] synthase
MIVGIGTDIVQIGRIERIYNKYQEAFLEKNFHSKEIECFYMLPDTKKISYLAKRFAGKEALSKALGTGIRDNFAFQDIAILNDKFGAPYVEIIKNNIRVFPDRKINISLSDDYPIAVAFVIISN